MKFKISRTSAYDEKPCAEARRMSVQVWHTRTVTEEEFNRKFSDREGLWRSKGREHKVVHNGEWISRRQKNEQAWGIEIGSLAELLILTEKYGRLIFSGGDTPDTPDTPEIEIYDDWRE